MVKGTFGITPQTCGYIAKTELSKKIYFVTFCQIPNARESWQTPGKFSLATLNNFPETGLCDITSNSVKRK